MDVVGSTETAVGSVLEGTGLSAFPESRTRMAFACKESINGARREDDGWNAGSVEADDREETMGSRYMEETKTLGNVLDSTCIDEANLAGFVRGKVLVTMMV